jgi:diaminopimelate epimerase
MLARPFHKYEGLGNDFVLIEADGADAVSADEARALCDRRRGIGGDGVLVVAPAAGADARMRVLNADGSVPEMCGNGLRCVAKHLAGNHPPKAGTVELRIETDAGKKSCAVDLVTGLVTVDMGIVRVVGEACIELDGETWDLILADAGNPHAVALCDVSRQAIERIGPRLASHPKFARGTNVEFARFSPPRDNGPRLVDLVVWERGVGVTHACGTGACATVAVGVAKGLVGRGEAVAVHLPGGVLHVTLDEDRAIMVGPAAHVFSGTTRGER